MGYNFNYGTDSTNNSEYSLQRNHVDELINLYGIPTVFLLVQKVNKDDLVFGDFSHLKADNTNRFDMMALPEMSDEWGDVSINFSEFGIENNETINLFVSRIAMDTIFPDIDLNRGFSSIVGNLVILNSNRLVEITDISFEVPGTSNLFTTTNQKNVYKFTCKTYNVKVQDELSPSTIKSSVAAQDYTTLDTYFAELTADVTTVDTEATTTVDTNTNTPVLSPADDVFGRF